MTNDEVVRRAAEPAHVRGCRAGDLHDWLQRLEASRDDVLEYDPEGPLGPELVWEGRGTRLCFILNGSEVRRGG